MSENFGLAANLGQQDHSLANGKGHHHGLKEASASPAGRPLITPQSQGTKQPFLQRGSGLKRRQEASTSEKRYVPKGGFVLDFSAEPAARAASTSTPASNSGSKGSATVSMAGTRRQLMHGSAARAPGTMRGKARASRSMDAAPKAQLPAVNGSPAPGPQLRPARGGTMEVTHARAAAAVPHAPAEKLDLDLELQEFEALERVLGSNSASAHSSPWPSPDKSADPGAAHANALSSPWPSPDRDTDRHAAAGRLAAGLGGGAGARHAADAAHAGVAAPDLAEDSDEEEDWEDAPLLYGGDPFHTEQQQPKQRRAPVAMQGGQQGRRGTPFVTSAPTVQAGRQRRASADGKKLPTASQKQPAALVPAAAPSAGPAQGQCAEVSVPHIEHAAGGGSMTAAQRHGGDIAALAMQVAEERREVLAQRLALEEGKAALALDRQAWQRQKANSSKPLLLPHPKSENLAEDAAALKARAGGERRRLERERAVLAQQSRALLKLPTKNARAEIEELQAALAEEKRGARARDARQKLIVERLRRQIVELQERVAKLQEEVRWHEQQHLQAWAKQDGAVAKASPPDRQQQQQRPGRAKPGHASGSPPPRSRPNTAAAAASAHAQPASPETVTEEHAQDGGEDEEINVKAGAWPGLSPAGDSGGCSPAGGSCPSVRPREVLEPPASSSTVTKHDPGHASDAHARITATKLSELSKTSGSRPGTGGSGKGTAVRPKSPLHKAVHASHQRDEAGQHAEHAHAQGNGRATGAAAGAYVRPDGTQAGQADAAAAEAAARALLLQQEEVSMRPQRAPAKPLPPVPRYDKLQQRRDPVTGALLSTGGIQGDGPWQVHRSGGSGTPLSSLDLGDAGLILANWNSHPAASPLSSFAYDYGDYGGSAAAVYSPLRASMRSSSQPRPQQPFAFGDSMAAGPPALALPPAAASDAYFGSGLPAAAPAPPAVEDACSGSRPPSRSSLLLRQGVSRGSAYDMAAYDAAAYSEQLWVPGSSEPFAMAQTERAGLLTIHHADEGPSAAASSASAAATGPDGAVADVTFTSWGGGLARAAAAAVSITSRPATGAAPVHAAAPPHKLSSSSGQDLLEAASSHALYTNVAAPGLLGHASVPVKETMHADGKSERVYGDGRRTVTFPNGTLKEEFPDGRCIVRFTNGDLKRTLPNGCVEYYYAEVGTWHTTFADGIEVFHFPSGQTEAHHPSGLKEILFADGSMRLVRVDGTEEAVQHAALSAAVQQAKPLVDV